MAEKKWSDYWGKYKSGYKPQSYNKTKIKVDNKSRATTKISPKLPKLSNSNINFSGIIMVLLTIGLIGLGFWQSKSAKMIEVLEINKTDLECQLDNCTDQLQAINSSLITTNFNFDNCNKDLTKKIVDLNACERDKGSINTDYNNCKDDLLQYRRDYENVRDDWNDCKSSLSSKSDSLSTCQSDLNSKQSSYDSLKSNFKTFCDSHCSGTCTWNSGNNKYECVITNTTTTTIV